MITSDTTLQINLSPGDIAYAALTVPALSAAHLNTVDHRLAVIDCCRPQATKIVDREARFPEGLFGERVEQISGVAEKLRREGHLDEVAYLRPSDPLLATLAQKYTGSWVCETHDYGGCGLMSYFAALELPRTRYVLHYDADVLLHQRTGFDWGGHGRRLMAGDRRIVAVTPRTSPPFATEMNLPDGPSRYEELSHQPTEGGWLNTWYSTRCFLVDRERLAPYLPLVQGRMLLETLAVRCLNRGYPRSPEIMLHRQVGLRGGLRLTLSTTAAWILHPLTKPPRYLELLPRIASAIARGDVPLVQRGNPEVDLAGWERYFHDSGSTEAVYRREAPQPQ